MKLQFKIPFVITSLFSVECKVEKALWSLTSAKESLEDSAKTLSQKYIEQENKAILAEKDRMWRVARAERIANDKIVKIFARKAKQVTLIAKSRTAAKNISSLMGD
jgi:hypothetical protein